MVDFAVRQAAARAVKRNKWSTSDSDKSDSDDSGDDFKMSEVESEISEEHSDSNASSDFNPFNSDSDSDNDPWSRKKKGKKTKKVSKKRPSTQDKIAAMLSRQKPAGKSKEGNVYSALHAAYNGTFYFLFLLVFS